MSRVAADFSPERNERVMRARRRITDTDSDTSEEEIITYDNLVAASGLPQRWEEENLICRQFVDDLSGTEKHPIQAGVWSLSEQKSTVLIHARKPRNYS